MALKKAKFYKTDLFFEVDEIQAVYDSFFSDDADEDGRFIWEGDLKEIRETAQDNENKRKKK